MMSRKVIHHVISAILVVFYALGICGMNIHSCSHTGERYVTFLFEGTSCQDIHPEHHHDASCDCEECCAGHECDECGDCCCGHDCDGDDGCCSNDSIQLYLTGDSDHASEMRHVAVDFPAIIVPQMAALVIEAPVVNDDAYIAPPALPGVDVLSAFCILRV